LQIADDPMRQVHRKWGVAIEACIGMPQDRAGAAGALTVSGRTDNVPSM